MHSRGNSNSNSFFCRGDGEQSQSQSQVRPRRAIRLDSQVSLSSLHDNNEEDPQQSMSGNPRSMFAPRDINAMPIDVKQRQQLLMGRGPHTGSGDPATSACGNPSERSVHTSSRPQSRGPRFDSLAGSMSNKSSASRPPLGLRMQNQLPKPTSLSHVSGDHNNSSLRHSQAPAHPAEGNEDDDMATEETVMMVDGVVFSTRSGPTSTAASSARHAFSEDGARSLLHGDDDARQSPSPARPDDAMVDGAPPSRPVPHDTDKATTSESEKREQVRDLPTFSGSAASAVASPTPPPRRAFVLSRLPSLDSKVHSVTTPTVGEPTTTTATTAAAAAAAADPMPAEMETSAPQEVTIPRESLLLVGGAPGTDDMQKQLKGRVHSKAESRASPSAAEDASFVLTDLPMPPAKPTEANLTQEKQPPVPVAAATHLGHRTLMPGHVVEEGSSPEQDTHPSAHAFAGRDSFDPFTDSSTLSPLPRPVNPPSTREVLTANLADAPLPSATKNTTEEAQPRHTPSEPRIDLCSEKDAANATDTGVNNEKEASRDNTTASSSNMMPYSLVSNAASLHLPAATTATAADSLTGADSIFIQSSMFLSNVSQGTGPQSKDTTGSMILVGGETPTPLRELRQNIREIYGGARHEESGETAAAPPVEGPAPEEAPLSPQEAEEDGVKALYADKGDEEMKGEEEEVARIRSPSPRPPTAVDATTTFHQTPPAPVAMPTEEQEAKSPVLTVSRTPVHARMQQPATASHASHNTDGSSTPQRRPTSLLGTPSARISDEVKELVERAQEEVRRTRDSLLSTLQAHQATFIPSAATLVHKAETAAKDEEGTTTATRGDGGGVKQQLNFAEAEATPAQQDLSTATPRPDPSLENPSFAPHRSSSQQTHLSRTDTKEKYFFSNWNINQLRSRLCESAGSIQRRLKGYDQGDHGVLPMETVMKVTLFVLHTKFGANVSSATEEGSLLRHLFTEESLAWLSSAAMATPMPSTRRSLPIFTPGAGRGAAGLLGHSSARRGLPSTLAFTPTPGRAGADGLPSPRTQERQMREVLTTATPGVYAGASFLSHASMTSSPSSSAPFDVTVSPLTGSSGKGRTTAEASSGRKRRRPTEHGESGNTSVDVAAGEEQEEEEEECRGRPATRMSPTRTLERVLAQQASRAAEEGFLSFYLFVLSAFREVFGERYALRHLGATNASRHDLAALAERGGNHPSTPSGASWRRRDAPLAYTTTMEEGTMAAPKRPCVEGQDGPQGVAAFVSSLGDIKGPIETAFPRLRQNYSMKEGGSLADGKPDPCRTPPLDVLVYYNTFAESLKEL